MLSLPTLVLNKSWSAIRVEPLQSSLIKAFKGTALLVDEETWSLHDWDSWLASFSIGIEDEMEELGYKFIRGCSCKVRVPEIIVLTSYNKIPHCQIKITRRNILLRDKFCCQYSGKRLNSRDATIDHVVPRSRGGKTEWSNVVICSLDANIKKGHKTLKEAGMKLIREPKEPKWHPLFAYPVRNKPKSWDKFVNTDKWNEIGYWDVELVD
jgi:5-methylcytosine-specific restriction endonuclease McrA